VRWPEQVDHEQLHPHTRLWFYSLAWADIDEARRAAKVCLLLARKPLTQEYFDHLELCVLRYGRPFAYTNTASGRKRTRLTDAFVKDAGMSIELHQKMLRMRHSVVAHSDMSHKLVRVRPMNRSPGVSVFECEPSWMLPALAEVESFFATAGKAVTSLGNEMSHLLRRHRHKLRRDDDGWLVFSPHPDD